MKNLDMARCDSTFLRWFCLWFEWDIPIYKVHGSSRTNVLKVFFWKAVYAGPIVTTCSTCFVYFNCTYTCSWNSIQCISIKLSGSTMVLVPAWKPTWVCISLEVEAYFLNVFWTVKDGIVLVWVYRETNKYCTKREKERDTVDGKNPAPPGMYPKPL